MAFIQPISTTRVTDTMTRGRLTSQIQGDQLELARLQQQISTGRRIFLPSDDAAASQRAMALQRTLERKEQSLTNLQGARASLTTTLDNLRQLSTSLNDVRAEALGVVDTIASDDERQAVINSIDQLLDQMTRVGNASFASNYLLGGAQRATAAYRQVDGVGYVEYLGDESSLQTYIDIGQVFDSGVSGDEVLGGFSEAVRGSTDLNVQLTPDTRLERLNGGLGIVGKGAIELTFVPDSSVEPTTQSVVDLSQAKTIDDVARLIEANVPEGASVAVSIENNALRIDVEDGGFLINEVGAGNTANELGILTPTLSAATIIGDDLDPTLTVTSRLDDLVGSKARGRIVSPGDNNDLLLTANQNGAQFNGVTVLFEDTATVGAETATYDAFTNTLTVSINDGESNAEQVAAAINAEGTFTAEIDHRDQTASDKRGTGKVTASALDLGVNVGGGSDGAIDLSGGLQITNGGDEPYVIDTSDIETVEQLLGRLNDPELGLLATVNATGDGIDVRTRRSGADFAIGENGGTTAADLGIRTYTEDSRLADFNRGVGVIQPGTDDNATRAQNGLSITVVDQGVETVYEIDPVGLTTVEDLIDRIATDTGGAVTASLATTGNGLVLTRSDVIDPDTPATGTVGLAGDTLSIDADTAGEEGNATFTIEIIDSGAGGLGTTVTDSTIVVDLGGSATETTATIAASISAQLPDHTVASDGTAAVAAPVAQQTATVSGGFTADEFTVSGTMAEHLGFLPEGNSEATSAGSSLASTDRNTLEVDSAFTTLLRMREALVAGDNEGLGREIERSEIDVDRITFGRAEIGVRLRNLESVQQRLADEEVTLRDALSIEIDADLVEVISDFTAKQASLEASLRISGALLGLTILDYL